MNKAIWFSRHQPSPEQIKDAARMGYDLLVTAEGLSLGTMELREPADLLVCVSRLLRHCAEVGAVAIFGVFAAPLLAQIARSADSIAHRGYCIAPDGVNGDFPCFASWNIMRSPEGGKPTFAHQQWLFIGRLNSAS